MLYRAAAGLVFELRHSLQLAHGHHAVEHPRQLGVRGNVGLQKNSTPFRIDAAGEQKRHEFKRPSLKISRVLRHRDGVKIRQEEKGLVGRLQLDPLFHGADIVADHQRSCRLNPAQHQWSGLSGHWVFPTRASVVHAHSGRFRGGNHSVSARPCTPVVTCIVAAIKTRVLGPFGRIGTQRDFTTAAVTGRGPHHCA